jgi:catechol 2,3-dioxygenase-like lactoylglutathione lyase family enzyme
VQVPTSVEPDLEFVVTATLIVADVARSTAFYRDVLGAEVLRTGEPTDHKPEVTATPPTQPNDLSLFLNLRVSDIRRLYDRWRSRGATFITEPKVHATAALLHA